jgi:magnesium chelatase family protein
MGYARVESLGVIGMVGHAVTVEAHVALGLPNFTISGLPDIALVQARDRVRAAVVNADEDWPQHRITVNLLPADLPKHGSGFDLAIAVAVLCASDALPGRALQRVALVGELGLDGQVRPVRGVLPMVVAASQAGLTRVIVPADNAQEATLVPGLQLRGVASLRQLIAFARDGEPLPTASTMDEYEEPAGPDLSDVLGQERGRFAVELAAAGQHHLALFGPPGAGKTMLAQRLPTVLPPLSDEESLEVTAVHSIAGMLPSPPRLIRQPPFQSPHHTATAPALVGGGTGLARPGALSLAHKGVLFLDEAPEFKPAVLNSLRQPLEDGWVTLARSRGVTRYPAQVQLVLAANPCPCGVAKDTACQCTATLRRRYLGRLSGPLMDRIDLQVTLNPVTAAAMFGEADQVETSEQVLKRVIAARAAAAERWAGRGFTVNARAPGAVLRRPPFRLSSETTAELIRRVDRGTLSARGYDRVLRISWTIVDLDGRSAPAKSDVDEALQLRTNESP